MAGTGRNLSLLCQFYYNVEAVEYVKAHCEKMASVKIKGNSKIVVRNRAVQSIGWHLWHYDLVLGVWCLSYLSTEEAYRLMARVAVALTDTGRALFIEPILDSNEQEFRFQKNQKQ